MTDPHRIHDDVRDRYGALARSAASGEACCGPQDLVLPSATASGCCGAAPTARDATGSTVLGYAADELAALPAGTDLGLGCGNPTAIASLTVGQTVLDLGSGAGIDCLLAAKRVAPSGRVIGVDMTPDMLALARRNAAKLGVTNVEFRLGEIEHLPLADHSVDVVISNCVINLAPDKGAVYREVFRVLIPGGRLVCSDVVALGPLPAAVAGDAGLRACCIGGAIPALEIERLLIAAGFISITVEVHGASRDFIKDWAPGSRAEDLVAAATVTARKPAARSCG